MSEILELFRVGYTLFDKNTYTKSDAGSIQVYVPVKPECPKLSGLAEAAA